MNADLCTDRTTLSPFLSLKSLASHLDCKGPSFTLDVIQSISSILHRTCPSEAKITEGCKAVQHTQDDFWPSNGEEDPEEDGAAWDDMDGTKAHNTHQQALKRRRVGLGERPERPLLNQSSTSTSRVTGFSVTMQDATTLSVPSTSIHSGFTSAGAHLQDLAKRKTGSAPEIDQDTLPQSKSAAQSSSGYKRKIASIKDRRREDFARPTNGQGTLSSFFVVPTKGDNASKERLVPVISPPLLLPSREIETLSGSREGTRHFSPSREPMLPIPQALAGHRLKSAPINTRPPRIPKGSDYESKRYPFFSSSPPPIESLIEQAEAGEEKVPYHDESHSDDRTQTVSLISDSRPATTLHITTTTQLRSTQAITKTLGVRRSMNGWTNRGGHSFSVPGRRSGR